MNISDKNITTLLESRNEQALKLLSEKYGGLCSSISYNVLGNRSDSEEVTNDRQGSSSVPRLQPPRPTILSIFLFFS